MAQVMEQVADAETGRMLEADASGTLIIPAELLGYPEPHMRYVVERVGGKLIVQPEAAPAQEDEQKSAFDKWQQQWKIVQREVSKSWPAGVSAVDVVSEMRR